MSEWRDISDAKVCKACYGTGEIEEALPELSYMRVVGDCAQCGGTGKVPPAEGAEG